MAEDRPEGRQNGIALLWAELGRRFLTPIPHVSFWAFLLVGVILYGGIPIWLELYVYRSAGADASSENLKVALTTFSPALAGAILTQVIFEEFGRNKRMMAFAILAAHFFFLTSIWLTLDSDLENRVAFPCAIGSCILAVLVWWIANGLNKAFQDEFDSDAPVGGPTSHEPDGDLKDYKF